MCGISVSIHPVLMFDMAYFNRKLFYTYNSGVILPDSLRYEK
jgi:hypothetical protein